jgi:tRNA (guanine-N7-)-methyltransferase
MSRTKLKKFTQLKNMAHVIQPKREDLLNNKFNLKGAWLNLFKKTSPIVVELGCGKGEYTVALAKMFPEFNYIGIDIKGSRIFTGAKIVEEQQLDNVLFIRTQIEYLESIFDKDEIYELWITFPDPQIKFNRRKKRLTSLKFLEMYKNILISNGCVHLKTDSMFLHGYTLGLLENGPFNILKSIHDIYGLAKIDKRLNIKTYYEKMFLEKKQAISYLKFSFL